MITPRKEYRSPNFGPGPIAVEFAMLHYTACSFQRTVEIFQNEKRAASSHLVIDRDGELYELVACWEGRADRAFHAGKSRWQEGQNRWEQLNDCAIGIELVNENGNLFPYSEEQYRTLQEVLLHFKSLYPALQSPERIIGHEHAAGWRGKADPGWKFEWARLFAACYPGRAVPERFPALSQELLGPLAALAAFAPKEAGARNVFFENLSLLIEKAVFTKELQA